MRNRPLSIILTLVAPVLLAGCRGTLQIGLDSESPAVTAEIAGPGATATPTTLGPDPVATAPNLTAAPPTWTATSSLEPTSTPAAYPTRTPMPPPAPAVERIRFAPGTTQATVEGSLPDGGRAIYVMGVAEGQFIEMNAAVGTTGRGLRFSIVGADGIVVRPLGEAHVRTVVPSTQDYYVELVSDAGAVDYRMSVLIPVRIRFAPGAISAEVAGSLAAGDVRHYVLRALAGQRMLVIPRTTRGKIDLVISGADGQVLLSGRVAGSDFDGVLPTTQDYLVSVRAEGVSRAEYTLEITIPPL